LDQIYLRSFLTLADQCARSQVARSNLNTLENLFEFARFMTLFPTMSRYASMTGTPLENGAPHA
jgi:hypothetical protein